MSSIDAAGKMPLFARVALIDGKIKRRILKIFELSGTLRGQLIGKLAFGRA